MDQELGKVQDAGKFEAREGPSSNAGEAALGAKAITVDRASQIWRSLLDHTGLCPVPRSLHLFPVLMLPYVSLSLGKPQWIVIGFSGSLVSVVCYLVLQGLCSLCLGLN